MRVGMRLMSIEAFLSCGWMLGLRPCPSRMARKRAWPKAGPFGPVTPGRPRHNSGREAARDAARGCDLERHIVDPHALVDAVLDIQIHERVRVTEREKAVGTGVVGLPEDVAVAEAVAETRHQLRLGVLLAQE